MAAIPKYEFFDDKDNELPQARTQRETLISNEKVESLRKYHLELAYLRASQGMDDSDANWKVRDIQDHRVIKLDKDAGEHIFFKVQWYDGDKQWVHMDDL